MVANNTDIEKCFWKAANITCDADTYLAWRDNGDLKDESGFCKATVIVEFQSSNFILTYNRYVGVPDIEEYGEPFEEKMERLTKELYGQMVESKKFEAEISQNLKGLEDG